MKTSRFKKLKLLFKKDMMEWQSSSFKETGKRRDWLGFVSSLVLIAFIYGVFIYVFHSFAKMYLSNVYEDVVGDLYNRTSELLTLSIALVFIVNVINGVRKMFTAISNSKDINVLICQPIGAGQIFLYKYLRIYLSQVITTLFVMVPICVSLNIISGIGGVAFYILMVVSSLLLPALSCAIASLIAVPYILFMEMIESKFIIRLIGYVIVIAIGFWIYGIFLNGLNQILQSGQISNFFDMGTIYTINKITNALYPAKLYTNMMLQEDVWLSTVILVVLSVACLVGSFFLMKKIYNSFMQKRLEGYSIAFKKKEEIKKHSTVNALLIKEFKTVLRTPGYAFQYFATTVTLPFMVYICVRLLISMASGMFAIDCSYAVAAFVVMMFAMLTNTFCATNISRDGKMYAMLKTLPVKVEQIIGCKLFFTGVVSLISVFISSLTLWLSGLINIGSAVFVFLNGLLFSLAGVAYATKKDMKSPCFPTSDNDEVVDSNSNLSTLILIGLLLSAISGIGSIVISIIVGFKSTAGWAAFASMGFTSLISVIVFTFSVIYLFKGLKKSYYEVDI